MSTSCQQNAKKITCDSADQADIIRDLLEENKRL
jgi:hypothetical protein